MPRKRGDSWVCQFRHGDQRLYFTLGKISKADANIAEGHIEKILASAAEGTLPPLESSKWLNRSSKRIKSVFLKARISITNRERLTVTELVELFNKDYKTQPGLAPRTIVRMKQCTEKLSKYFKTKYVDEIGVREAKSFSVWLRREYKSESTWSKSLQRCKQAFTWAIDHEIASKNPFRTIKGGKYSNDDRQFYVSASTMNTILDKMPEGDFKIAAALARYGGFRLPSELTEFTWDRVNLPERVMVVWDVKRKRDRVTPIFPELYEYLVKHWELFGDKSAHVIVDPIHRDPEANLRTTFGKYVVRAGHAKWPRLLQNLRASCETDLLNRFPIHQVVKWIGNSPNVALRHYAMVSDQDLAKAAAEPLTPKKQGETNDEDRSDQNRERDKADSRRD